MRVDSAEMAPSNASGPSTIAWGIWLRSAIFARHAASIVDGTAGLTVSIDDRTATRGCSSPKQRASSTALLTIAALVMRSGAMFTAASEIMSSFG